MRTLPVWTDDPNTLCQQGEMMQQQQQPSGNPFDQSSQPQQPAQQQPPKEEKSDGVAGWIKRCSAAINHGNSAGWRCAYPVYTVTTPLCAT